MHARAIFAVGAALLAFASEGLQGLTASIIQKDSLAAQVAIIGVFIIGYAFLEIFGKPDTPKAQSAVHHVRTKKRKLKRDRLGRFVSTKKRR